MPIAGSISQSSHSVAICEDGVTSDKATGGRSAIPPSKLTLAADVQAFARLNLLDDLFDIAFLARLEEGYRGHDEKWTFCSRQSFRRLLKRSSLPGE